MALARQLSHLPVIADPSHATGRRDLIPAMCRAALAAGADGLIIEVHPDPQNALSDGMQSWISPRSTPEPCMGENHVNVGILAGGPVQCDAEGIRVALRRFRRELNMQPVWPADCR